MRNIMLWLLLVLLLVVLGVWGLTAYEQQQAQRLQAQATLGLVQTVRATQSTLTGWLLAGSFTVGVALGLYGATRRNRPARHLSAPAQVVEEGRTAALWRAYRQGQQDALRQWAQPSAFPPGYPAGTPVAYPPALPEPAAAEPEEPTWALPAAWF